MPWLGLQQGERYKKTILKSDFCLLVYAATGYASLTQLTLHNWIPGLASQWDEWRGGNEKRRGQPDSPLPQTSAGSTTTCFTTSQSVPSFRAEALLPCHPDRHCVSLFNNVIYNSLSIHTLTQNTETRFECFVRDMESKRNTQTQHRHRLQTDFSKARKKQSNTFCRPVIIFFWAWDLRKLRTSCNT